MTFQILSISGGGFQGLYSAAVLAEIEAVTGRPLRDSFDLIAGTSIGGIIGLGVAAGKPASDIRDAIERHGPNIFTTEPPSQSQLMKYFALGKNAGKAKYTAGPLKVAIEEIVGPDARIGDLRTRFIAPAVNLTKGQPQLFKTAHHPTFVRDWKLKIVDVALATSAAPTFFPLHKIGAELFADGGLYANSPDQLAIHEAEYFLEQPTTELRVLSIGSTTSSFSFSHSQDVNMGWMAWMSDQRLPSAMIASQQLIADFVSGHKLQDNYIRIDQRLSREQERYLALDVASAGAISDLKGLAEASVREHLGRPKLRTWLAHQAAPATFYHLGGS